MATAASAIVLTRDVYEGFLHPVAVEIHEGRRVPCGFVWSEYGIREVCLEEFP
jgi:hypothetical protein